MKALKLAIALTFIWTLFLFPLVVLASSGGNWLTTVTVTNNGTATADNACVTFNLPTSQMIAANMLNNSANDCAIKTSAGVDIPFMPGINSTWYTFVGSIPGNTQQRQYLYSKGATGGSLRYFPSATGMSVSDNDTNLEPSNNFTMEWKGYLDMTGMAGSGLAFTSANATSADASAFSWLHGNADASSFNWTIEGWYKINQPTSTTDQNLVSTNPGDSGQAGIRLSYNNRQFTLTIYRASAGTYVCDGTSSANAWPNDTGWHHLRVTYTQSLATLNAKFYVDGAAQGTLNKTANTPSSANATRLYLGQTATGSGTSSFNGTMDEVRISIIDRGAGINYYSIPDSNTYAQWHMNENGGDTIYDATGYHNLVLAGTYSWASGMTTQNLYHGALVNKPGAIQVYSEGSNITAEIYRPLGVNNDFITYTEVDPNAKLTVTATKALAADADRDENASLYKDLGANYFDALDIDFEIYIASTSDVDAVGGMAITNTVSTIHGLATTDVAVVIYKADVALYKLTLYRGASVATDFYTCSANTIYYCTLSRVAGSDSVHCLVYSDAARTVPLDDLVVGSYGTSTKWRYLYGFVNRNSGSGGMNFDGYVQNMNLKETYRASVGGVSSMETTITVRADGVYFWVTVGSLSSANTTIAAGISDNSSNWQFLQNNVMPYCESVKVEIGGNLRGSWAWEYGTTFTDLSGSGNTATPSFRADNSNAYVSATVTGQQSTLTAEQPSSATAGGWTMIESVPSQPYRMYEAGSKAFPGRTQIIALANTNRIPYEVLEFILAIGSTIVVSFVAFALTHSAKQGIKGSLLIQAVATMCMLVYWYLGAEVLPGWILIPVAMWIIVLLIWRNPFSPAAS